MQRHVMVVAPDPRVAGRLAYTLKNAGYAVQVAREPEQARHQSELAPPDLILLDLSLPGQAAERVINDVRPNEQVPVIGLKHGARAGSDLPAGISEQIESRCGNEELLACVGAYLPLDELAVGELRVNLRESSAWLGARELSLSGEEVRVLALLARYAGRVLSEDEMATRLGYLSRTERAQLRPRLESLRSSLGDGGMLREIRGCGFVLRAGGQATHA